MIDSYEVFAHIVGSNPSIESITTVIYEEGLSWRDRRDCPTDPDPSVLLKGLQQDRKPRMLTKLPRREVARDGLIKIAGELREGAVLAVSSLVQLDNGESAHIPMMDFVCTPSTLNLGLVTKLVRDVNQGRGWLLNSGRSYHYYGFHLLTDRLWQMFLGKCLLMSGFADDRYIGHQLVDGHCVLRLSAGKLKTLVPIVVSELS